jgi:dsRNA-specific ribonuclease
VVASGSGKNKKAAETEAAKWALTKLSKSTIEEGS